MRYTEHYGPQGFFAIEVKASTRLRPNDFVSLHEFAIDFPEARRVVVYLGNETRTFQGIDILPATEFLLKLPQFLTETK